MWNVLLLGLVNWIATTIVVESELFRPLREFIEKRRTRTRPIFNRALGGDVPGTTLTECRPVMNKLAYMVGCHLCTGTWVALAESAVLGAPWRGFSGFIAGALLYKAVGHLVLELRPQAWLPRPQGGS